ncbi:hypothetical protein EDD11_009892 [Mortierella claussenii]|nr:hypothetical protein EDD11_009892 [Mortierella claussenii]
MNTDYTTQHIITPVFEDYSKLEHLSDEGLAEMTRIQIVQEPLHLDDMKMLKIYIRLVISNETVGSMLSPPYEHIPAASVMVCMRNSIFFNSKRQHSQAY